MPYKITLATNVVSTHEREMLWTHTFAWTDLADPARLHQGYLPQKTEHAVYTRMVFAG
jgi:hypothetical protein